MTQYMDSEELWLPDDPRVAFLIQAIQGTTPDRYRAVLVTPGGTGVDLGPQCTCANADLFGCAEVGCHEDPDTFDQS